MMTIGGMETFKRYFFIIGIVFAILSPIVATLIQLAVSRKREYLADASGALLTKIPGGTGKRFRKARNRQNTS